MGNWGENILGGRIGFIATFAYICQMILYGSKPRGIINTKNNIIT